MTDRIIPVRYVNRVRGVAEDRAMAYAWGWQDARLDDDIPDQAMEFSIAFGAVAAWFAAEVRPIDQPLLNEAWLSWLQHGRICDEDGRPYDQIQRVDLEGA